MNRRDILSTLPAVAAGGLLPSSSIAAEPTPMMALYRQWEDLRDVARRTDIPEDIGQKATDDLIAIEERMVAMPSTCLHDFLAKLLADTSGGHFEPCEAIMAEAKALIGARD